MIYVSTYNSIKETLKNEPQPPGVTAFFHRFSRCAMPAMTFKGQCTTLIPQVGMTAETRSFIPGGWLSKNGAYHGIPPQRAMFIEDNDENDENFQMIFQPRCASVRCFVSRFTIWHPRCWDSQVQYRNHIPEIRVIESVKKNMFAACGTHESLVSDAGFRSCL